MESENPAVCREADERIRTADPFITSEVLYQLSYVGKAEDRSVLDLSESGGSLPLRHPPIPCA